MRVFPFALLAPALLLAGCAGAPPPDVEHAAHEGMAAAAAPVPPPLFEDLGGYHRAIATTSPRAQDYFDQGLRLVYSFNHYEALASFEEALRADPDCALCHWGVAIALGSNYNSPTDAEREARALAAVERAQALAAGASPVEQALIAAVARRHSADPRAERGVLDRRYAEAMREVARSFPDDADAATLFADALMNLRPWDLWRQDGEPYAETPEVLAALEAVLARQPDHPGANHLYIHALEASPEPQRAEAAADRLRELVPGAGHMVHMPSHIYYRVGRYADALAVNERAVAADRAYFQRREPSPIYRMLYYPHNLDFVWQAAAMEGRSAESLRAARELAGLVTLADVAAMPDMEIATAAPLYALARFGRWQEVLAEPEPAQELLYTRGIRHYARGLAHLGLGQSGEAAAELAALEAFTEEVPPARTIAGYFKAVDFLRLAADVLRGEIAAKAGRTDEAVAALERAVAAQDTHWFTEPPPWYYPVRQSLAAVLLAAGRAAEAEEVYRQDLRKNPLNGWSIYGLLQSLRVQGEDEEAMAVEQAFRDAWARADVEIAGSRF